MSKRQKIDHVREELDDARAQIHADLAEDDAAFGRFAQAERNALDKRIDKLHEAHAARSAAARAAVQQASDELDQVGQDSATTSE